jgi:SAM-dependent methyltransferase
MPTTDFEYVPCPLCGSAHQEIVQRGPDYLEHIPGSFTLVGCLRCGLLYQNPRPTRAAVGRFYPDHYGAYGAAQSGLRARRGLLGWVTRRGMARRCELLDRAVPPRPDGPRRLLDVGSGGGLFLEAVQLHGGWRAEGLEPNAQAARATAERLGLPVLHGGIEDARYPDASFDAVTLWDVLEHLHDPLGALRELRRILRPGGALFVRVPNAASYVRALCGRYWVGYDLPRHMTVFSPATLGRALAGAGFARIARRYTSGSYLYLIHSLRFALDDGRLPPERAAALHRRLYHPLARALALPPLALADRAAGGSALEVLALAPGGA